MIKSHTFQNIEKLPFEEGVPSQIKVQNMKNWLNNNNDKYNLKYVVMYHGTGVNIPILEQGLKPTSITRRRSYQSTSNYVYLANTPQRAKLFGDLGNSSKSVVYAVRVLVRDLKADIDQLNNLRIVGNKIGNSLAESIIYGGGARIKGKVPPQDIELLTIKR